MVKSQVIYKDYSKDAERTALVSGENLSHMFGKIARWYTDISWVGHTHTEANITDFGTYAGASTKGGAATSANKLNIGSADIGSETKPVYFSYLTGKPVACTYSLNASVPANAVFTDINVKQSPSTADESREVLFAGNTGNTETTGTVGKSNKLYFNPSTGALTATSFSGSIAASNLTGTIDAGRLPTTSVTAGSYGPAAGGTLTYGGTFDVPYVTVDKYGRLTAGSTKTFTLPAQYVHPSTSGNKHIPSGGSSGQYLKWSSDGTATWSAIAAADLPSHTHSEYLPLAGGTMTGDLAFTAVTSTTYPAASNQISFGGSTDGGQIFFEVQASDAGALVIQTTDDPNAKIVFRNKVTSGGTRANEVTITDGVISGNGSGLTSLNASNISSGTIAAARLPDSYLPLKGGTMTGAITFQIADAIKYNAAGITTTMISFITGDSTGNGISIGGGGSVVIGSGEASSALITDLSISGATEQVYIASDNDIYFYSKCQTITNRLGIVYDNSGQLRPDTNNTRALGGTDFYWNKAYISQILGRGTGGMWISARDNAIVRQSLMSTGSSYFPVISAKTKLGEWSIGTLGPDAENFYISYTTDANYSAGSNNSKNYYISKDGWFNGTAAKADVWTTARTITIGSTSKSVNGSGNVSWSLSEIGAAPASHSHNYIGAISDGSYWGMGSPSLDGSAWIRTTSNGLIPYQSGGRTSSHSSIGTSSWYFSYAYINSIYVDSIGFNGTKATTQMIKFLDNTSDGNGNGILIGGGGVVCVGAGESASALNSASVFSPGTEQLYLAADGQINFYTNCDTVANRIQSYIDTSGRYVGNEIIGTNANGLRVAYGGYGFFIRNDGSNTYFMLTDKKTDGSEKTAGYNSLRPLSINNSTGMCTINGVITRADYPTGFSGRSTSQTWGKQTGTFMTAWYGPNSSSIAFRYDCPNSGQASVIIDGRFYQDEGQYMCLDESNFVNYAARSRYVDSFLSANRFAFAKAAGVTVQYSRDGGSTLNTYSLTDAQKIAIFTTDVSGVTIGNVSSDYATSQYRTYITLDANTAGLYSQINEFTIRVSTNGSNGTKVYIEGMTVGGSTWSVLKGWTYIAGWSGTNHIPINPVTFGTGSGHIQKIRFTFGCDSGATSGNYHGMQILHIYGFGGEGWGVQSSLGLTGHMYTWDTNKNVTFPAQITCDVGTIHSIATRSAKTATSVTHSDYTDDATVNTIAPTMGFIAYWNGAYNSSGSSNLAYCNKGAFGTIITKGSGDYIPISGSSNITGFLRVVMGNTAGPKISVNNGTYEIGLHVGSGGVNHGIYDFTSSINTWMCYHNGTEFLFNGKANTATTASKLGTNAGSNVCPVYFSGGVPVACKQVASGAYFSIVPYVRSDGVMDIGRYLDFHVTNDATSLGYRLNQWSAGCIEFNSYNANNIVQLYAPSGYAQLRFGLNETNKAYTAAGIIVNPLTTSGSVMRIQCGGNMIIGGGESPSTIYSNDYLSCATSESESLFLTADGSIQLVTNLDSYANRKTVTVSNGQIILANNGYIAQDQNSGSNYTTAIRWRKGASDPGNYGPEIGQHNTGDTDGSICILPYHTSSNPWDAGVGLFISKTRLLYNGTAISLNGHTHSYLPLSGGTLTGDLNFTGVTSTSYPAKSNQIYFSGSTDWAKIYYRVDASDAGRLVFDIGDDTNTRIDFAYNGTTKSYIDTSGNFSGASYRANYLDIVAGNEIRFSNESRPANAIDLYLGYAWSGGTKDAKINRYVFMNGNATLTNVKAALFEGKSTSSAYTNYDAAIAIQTGSSKQAKISLETLINWLINTKKVLPASTLVHKIIHTTWAYANNDFLQISCNGRSYEIQLAGVILEFIGSVSSYNSGEFRLFIHTSPTTSGSASSGYVIAPTSTTFVYTCNGSGYSPTWKMISNFGKYANGYWGLTDPNGNDNDWTRTTTQGIIPYQGGSLGSGHQSLGTSSWYFSHVYSDQLHGYSLGLGSSSIQGRITIQSPTTASVAYNSTNPRIRFANASSDQNIDIVMCDFDSVRGPAALSVHGNQGGEWLLAPNISAWDYTNNRPYVAAMTNRIGTTSTKGLGLLEIGNGIATGTAGNAYGLLRLFSASAKYVDIVANDAMAAAITMTLPPSGGTMTDIVYKPTSAYSSLSSLFSGSTTITSGLQKTAITLSNHFSIYKYILITIKYNSSPATYAELMVPAYNDTWLNDTVSPDPGGANSGVPSSYTSTDLVGVYYTSSTKQLTFNCRNSMIVYAVRGCYGG